MPIHRANKYCSECSASFSRRPRPRSICSRPNARLRPFTESGFAKMVERAANKAGPEALKVHPHMLRHACGYALVNAGRDTRSLQGYLRHKNIRHTEKYTKLSPDRFKDFGKGAR
jgi:site-specific recombinase XerD